MNTVKKITAEVADKDFKAFVEWRIVKGIHHWFHDNYMAFWDARKRYKQYQEQLKKCVIVGDAYKKLVHRNLDKFDLLSIDTKTLKAIFRGVPNYSKYTEKYLIQRHGVRVTPMGKGKPNRRMPYGNIYSPSLERLKEIFGDRKLLGKILDKRNNEAYFTPRQMHLIANFVKEEKKRWKSKNNRPVMEEDIQAKTIGEELANCDDFF